jgi:hypothetical protein
MPYTYTYPDYMNTATGKALTVTAGSSYTCAIFSGRLTTATSFPNDGRWTNATTFIDLTRAPEPARPEPPARPLVIPATEGK